MASLTKEEMEMGVALAKIEPNSSPWFWKKGKGFNQIIFLQIVKGAIERLDLPTRKELNDLKSEIEQLKEKLNKKE